MAYTPIDYETLYAGIGNARKSALDAALAQQQAGLADQAGALGGQYNDMRGQAYTNARTSALGNNERLAAMGLAGNAYAGPQTGYSESSRITQDTALGNALNAANRQEQGARDALALQGNNAVLNRNQTWAQTAADLEGQKMNAIGQQNQFMANLAQQEAALAEQVRQNNQQQENWNRNYTYNQGRDAITDQHYTDETAYAHGRDAVSDKQWTDTFNTQNDQWNKTFEFNKAQANRRGSKYNAYKGFDDKNKGKDTTPTLTTGANNPGGYTDYSNLGGIAQLEKLVRQGLVPIAAVPSYAGIRR